MGKTIKYDDRRRTLVNELYKEVIKLCEKNKINYEISNEYKDKQSQDHFTIIFFPTENDKESEDDADWASKKVE